MTQLSDDKRRRYSILISNIEQVFNRLNADINQLQSKNMSLIGFLLTTISIVIAFFAILITNGTNPPIGGYILIGLHLFLMGVAIALTLRNFYPTGYLELDIFEESRFKELKKLDEGDLYSDTLYNYEKAHTFNENKRNNMVRDLKISAGLYVTSIIILIIFLFLLIYVGV